jgi:acyl-CoA thioester hydrolase
MSRVKISLPHQFSFSASIPIRIGDINYGNHVGNDAVLSIIHEARVQFLNSYGFTELNCEGAGLIMTDVAIEFKKEIFYGDVVEAKVAATNFTNIGFDLYYQLSVIRDNNPLLVAAAKTGMICYNYTQKKITAVPAAVKTALQ